MRRVLEVPKQAPSQLVASLGMRNEREEERDELDCKGKVSKVNG